MPPGFPRELSVAEVANSVNRVQPAPVAKRQCHTREQVLAGLERREGWDARFLGPTPVEVPEAGACHLVACHRLAGDSQQGVPLRIALDRSPSMVGRNDRGGADILLVDPREPHVISLQHAVFRFVCPVASPGHAGGWWEVCDLGSLNGTVVNGVQHRKTCARLAEGDKIVFGAGGALPGGSQWKGTEEMKLAFTFHHNTEAVLAGATRWRDEIGFEQARAAKRSRPACDVSKHGEGDAAARGSAPRAKHELNKGGEGGEGRRTFCAQGWTRAQHTQGWWDARTSSSSTFGTRSTRTHHVCCSSPRRWRPGRQVDLERCPCSSPLRKGEGSRKGPRARRDCTRPACPGTPRC